MVADTVKVTVRLEAFEVYSVWLRTEHVAMVTRIPVDHPIQQWPEYDKASKYRTAIHRALNP